MARKDGGHRFARPLEGPLRTLRRLAEPSLIDEAVNGRSQLGFLRTKWQPYSEGDLTDAIRWSPLGGASSMGIPHMPCRREVLVLQRSTACGSNAVPQRCE